MFLVKSSVKALEPGSLTQAIAQLEGLRAKVPPSAAGAAGIRENKEMLEQLDTYLAELRKKAPTP